MRRAARVVRFPMPLSARSFRFRSRRSTATRVLQWIGLALLALIALILLAGAALVAFGGNGLRGPIERAALEKTGRALKIDGDIRFGFGWPPRLQVRAGKIAFANADWAKQQPNMLTTDEVDLALDLPQLLIGRPVVDELRLRNADVSLEKDASGRKNWALKNDEKSTVPLGRVALDNSRIDYQEPARNTALHAQVAATASGLSFTARGTYLGQAVDAHGSGGPLVALQDESEPYPFQADATIGPTHAKAAGSITGLANLTALDIQAEVHGESLDDLFPLIGVALPETPAYRTSGHLVHEGKTWRYEKFGVHLGSSDMEGTLQVDAAGKRPAMSGEVVFGLLDVADLGAAIGTHKPRNRVLPDSPFHADRWNSVDADVRLSARKIVRPQGIPLERFATHLRLRDAVLTLEPLEFGIAGGHVSGTIRLDGSQDPIRAAIKAKIAKIALDRLVPGFNTKEVDPGRIDGAVDLSGHGNSVADMLGDADGSVAILINGGHVSRTVMEEIGLHIPEIVAAKLGGDQRVGIRCGAADFQVADGVMHTRNFIFDTTVSTLGASGDIHLDDETLDLTLLPRTKETSLVSLHGPVHIRGSFSKPDVQLDKGRIAAKSAGALALAIANPLLALIPLMETGPGADSDCGRLLTASPAAEDVKKAAKGLPRSK
jgi:AsmA protein